MKRSIRFTRDEYGRISSFAEYLKIGSIFPQKFDDNDVINLLINYAWKREKKRIDIMFETGYEPAKKFKEILGPLSGLILQGDLTRELDYIDKSEHKTILISEESEKFLAELSKKYPGKTNTDIIKTLVFNVIGNPDLVLAILIKLLLEQVFLFISISRTDGKYSYKKGKQDLINMQFPKFDIYEIDAENFHYVIDKLKGLKKYEELMTISRNNSVNEEVLGDLVNVGFMGIVGAYRDQEIPKSVNSMSVAGAKIMSRAAPMMAAIKLTSVLALYTTMKEIKEGFAGAYPALFDKLVSLFLIQHKQDRIAEYYGNVYNALFSELKEWEEYIQKYKTI